METLLIVDDDLSLLESLKMHFEEAEDQAGRPRFRVVTATSAMAALQKAREVMPALVILDMMLPDRNGLDIILELRAVSGDAPIVIVTAYHDMETTIRAMKSRAFDYIRKPFSDPSELDQVVDRALRERQISRQAEPVAPDSAVARLGDIVGTSPAIQQLVKEIGRVAGAVNATVLLSGESGTGKELIARVIHNYSFDDARPFVGINCSAIVDTLLESELFGHERGAFTGAIATKVGRLEAAKEGTVFLDEIGDMSLMLQAKLLRVLQEREFERVGGVKRLELKARVIAATHRNLADEVAAGRFREDLYQRLKVFTLHIPPLRERPQDIPALVHHLLGQLNQKHNKRVTRVPQEVMEHLSRLPWRGNVRELANALERAVGRATGEVLLADDLPRLEGGAIASAASAASTAQPPDPERFPSLEEMERQHILKALALAKGHKGKTCQLLGISRPTLERKLRKNWGPQGPPDVGR
jgi:two-component system response regulator AtoC